jgi:hypothetical protein
MGKIFSAAKYLEIYAEDIVSAAIYDSNSRNWTFYCR